MLQQRAERLEQDDVEGFLAPLSADARPIEEPIARGSTEVPLSGVEFSITNSEGSSEFFVRGLELDLVYRYERLANDNAFRISLLYDLDRVGGKWSITSSILDQGAALPVWAAGPIEFTASDHFLALYRPSLPSPASAISQAERARSRLAPKLDFEMDPVHLILLATDEDEYRSMSAGASPVSAIAQAETTFAVSRNRIAAESRLILVNLARTGERTAVETLQHELGHLALSNYTRPFTPAWVSESAAMYLAETRPVGLWARGIREGKFNAMSFSDLTSQPNLGQHDPSGVAVSFEYAYAAAAAWYLTETFGPQPFWSFYRSYSEVPAGEVYSQITDIGAGLDTDAALEELAVETTRAGLTRLFGLTEERLDSQVRKWIQKESR